MGSMKSKTILVAEDNSDTQNLLRFFLQREGYNVVEAVNGLAAVEAARQNTPDLILLDLNLPLLDGVNVAIQIRKQVELRDVPILANSADGIRGIELFNNIKKLGEGYIGYLTKPLDLKELILQINSILSEKSRAA